MKTKSDEKLQKKISELQLELRQTKLRLRDVEKSRENHKVRAKVLKKELKDEQKKK